MRREVQHALRTLQRQARAARRYLSDTELARSLARFGYDAEQAGAIVVADRRRGSRLRHGTYIRQGRRRKRAQEKRREAWRVAKSVLRKSLNMDGGDLNAALMELTEELEGADRSAKHGGYKQTGDVSRSTMRTAIAAIELIRQQKGM